ncbi:MAG: DUF4012 domain-containing protein, partial [Acidimicrobiales bacterium]
VRAGAASARAGIDAAADGDNEGPATYFDTAAAEFGSARRLLSGFWTLPARLVPVVGQHARASQVLASEGVSLATTAADTARTIDLDAVRLVDGAIDLDAIDQLAPVLDRTERAIERAATRIAEVRDPWLIPFVDERLADLADRLDGALPAARMAHLAAVEGPELLGADAPVRWLVALVTPAEARGLGGLLGSYATVTAADGVIEIESIGRNEDVNELLASIDPVLEGSDDYVSRWGPYRPQEFFQDVTMSPDLPDVAEVMASLYEQATGDHVDGVMVADPHVVGAILDLTGPITATGGVVRRLDSDNAVDYLLRGQYADFADDEVGRVVLLASIIESTFDALTSGRLPGPRGLAAELGPLIDQDRLGAWWAGGGRAAELFAAAGLDGAFPRPDGSDLLAVVHQNSGQNKIDVFLRRSIRYEIEHLDGRTRATVTVDLTNTAPRTGLPDSVIGNNDQDLPTGTNAMLLSVYTALDVDGVLVDGVPANVRREREFGYEVATLPLTIPAGRTVTLQVEVTGIVERSDQLIVAQQPLVDDDRLT